MANKRFLILVPFLAFSFLGSIDRDLPIQASFITYFDCIGPFEKGCQDYQLTGMVEPIRNIAQVREKMTVKTMDGLLIKTQITNTHYISKNIMYLLTFKLPLKSNLTDRGLSVTIDFIDTGNVILQSFSFNIKPVSPTTINPKLYTNEYFVIEDVIVDPDDYQTHRFEKIKFDKTYDYFDVDNYYRLPLEDTFITYECGLLFPGCTAHLHFTDYLKVFPYLDNDKEVPTFDIPLKVNGKIGGVSFSFPSVMYVNPSTLDMSLEARPGFSATRYFYLPKNRSEELLDQTFYLAVKDFGYGKTSFTWPIKYTNNHHLIGDCSNSDYCVIGDMSNG